MPLPKYSIIKLSEKEAKKKKRTTLEDCQICQQKCCRYISVQLDNPDEKEDFDQLIWMMLHQGVGLYVEDGDWYVEVKTICEKLDKNGNCTYYKKRPKMCREYGTGMEKDSLCEGFQNVYHTYDHYFSDAEELKKFIPKYLKQLAEEEKEAKRIVNRLKRVLETINPFKKEEE